MDKLYLKKDTIKSVELTLLKENENYEFIEKGSIVSVLNTNKKKWYDYKFNVLLPKVAEKDYVKYFGYGKMYSDEFKTIDINDLKDDKLVLINNEVFHCARVAINTFDNSLLRYFNNNAEAIEFAKSTAELNNLTPIKMN